MLAEPLRTSHSRLSVWQSSPQLSGSSGCVADSTGIGDSNVSKAASMASKFSTGKLGVAFASGSG
jgi:hypothetical protein